MTDAKKIMNPHVGSDPPDIRIRIRINTVSLVVEILAGEGLCSLSTVSFKNMHVRLVQDRLHDETDRSQSLI